MDLLETIAYEIGLVMPTMDRPQIEAAAQELALAQRVVVAGEARSGLAARMLNAHLARVGIPAYAVGDVLVPEITHTDTVVVVSGSGMMARSVEAARHARDLGSIVIGVTRDGQSDLGRLASPCLLIDLVRAFQKADLLASGQPVGTLFEQCALLALDAVAVRVAAIRDGWSDRIA